MRNWFRKKPSENNPVGSKAEPLVQEPSQPAAEQKTAGWWSGLVKTRQFLGGRLKQLFTGKQDLDDETREELETILLSADIGLETTNNVLDALVEKSKSTHLKGGDDFYREVKNTLEEILLPCQKDLDLDAAPHKPYVILMVGINGAGKTTTIGKLAKQLEAQGKKVMLAAGDTFRAAAVEQLQVWGERNNIPVIAQHTGADSASVVYDAIMAARARKYDVLIADTAGRLHTQGHLMEELKKIKRVMGKLDSDAPHETMLVIDGGIGQNALAQAREFHQAIGLTGISVTKLDGTAKGGIVFAIAKDLNIPFRYVGVGESIDDLKPFDAHLFVEAIFHDDSV